MIDQILHLPAVRFLAAALGWPFRTLGLVDSIALLLAGLAISCEVAAVGQSGGLGTNPFYVFGIVLALLAVPVGALAALVGKTGLGSGIALAVTVGVLVATILIPIARG